MNSHECPWALISTHVRSGALISMVLWHNECSLAIRNTHGCSWLLTSANECQWVLMSAHDCSWKAVRRILEHSWAWGHGAMSTHESSKAVMSMVPSALIITHERSLCHSTILMSAHECSWAHMSACESSWALMRVHKCWTALLNNRQKLLTFEMISL